MTASVWFKTDSETMCKNTALMSVGEKLVVGLDRGVPYIYAQNNNLVSNVTVTKTSKEQPLQF